MPSSATPSNRSKLLTEAFGGLGQLTGEAQLRARRQAERNVQRAREQKLNGRDYASRVTGRVIGEAIAKLLGNGNDAELDRARLVDDAVEAAQGITGFQVPEAQRKQIESEVRAQGAQQAQQAAAQKAEGIQTTNAFEQQHLLVTNTMKELVNRGLTTEASQLLPTLKAIEEAEVEERKRIAELEGKELANADARDGDTKTIVPNAIGAPIAAQVFSDGTARYWDEEKQAEVTIRPGQYFIGQVTGTTDDLTDKLIKNALPQLRGQIDSMAMMTDLRAEIRQNPEALTLAGDAFAFMNNYVPDLRQLQRERWRDEADLLSDNKSEFDREAQRLGITNARQRIAVEKLAFALASARENGKLSVSDVEMAARAFGQGERDARVRMALIDDVAKDLRTQYETIGVLDERISTIPLYQRAGTFFDAYDSESQRSPVRPIGEPDDEIEDPGNALFKFDDGVTIE